MDRRLRIAIWHNLPSGGGKRQLYNHVQGLLKRGHHLESWCPDTADQTHLPLGSLIREHVVPLKRTSELFYGPVRPLRATRELIEAMEAHCRRCANEIADGHFDLLFANACMFLRTTPVARFVPLPTALYLGEPFRSMYEALPELPWIAPSASLDRPRSWAALRDLLGRRSSLNGVRLQARAELEYVKAFDVVLTNSIFSRETLLRTYNVDSTVCYLGVDTDLYRPTGEAKEPFVVGLGTIYIGKGVERAIRALAAVDAARRPALVWIGNVAWPDALTEYQRLAKRLGVEFTARINIPDRDVVSLLSRATAMICTSRLEPFGLAPLEANACGTPVVAVAEGGIRETIEDGVNGFLAPDDEPGRLGSLVARLVCDPALAARMGADARRHVEAKWNLERGTDNIESMLAGLSKAKAATARLGDKEMLRALQPTNNVRFYVEHRTIRNGTLSMTGWAHINDGRDATGSEIYLVLRSASDIQVIKTRRVLRRDLTLHFGDVVDYDDSGFTVTAVVGVREPYETGILVIRASEIALQLVS